MSLNRVDQADLLLMDNKGPIAKIDGPINMLASISDDELIRSWNRLSFDLTRWQNMRVVLLFIKEAQKRGICETFYQ